MNDNARPKLTFRHLIYYGLAYIAPIAPLTTIGFVWNSTHGEVAASYILAGICIFFTANSYAMMVREIRDSGSVYGYASQVFGPFVGFLAGWVILLDYLLIPAYVYVSTSVSLQQIAPFVTRSVWIVLFSLFTFGVNWFGLKSSNHANRGTVVIQVVTMVVLFGLALWALLRSYGGPTLGPLYSPGHFSPTAILSGTAICMMSFLGFDAISTLTQDAEDLTGRTVGRAILSVVAIAALLFVSTTWLLSDLLQHITIEDPASAIYEVVSQCIGQYWSLALAIITAIVIGFTNALPMQIGVAKVLSAMGRDGQMPRILARTHPKYHTPWVAMSLSTLLFTGIAVLFSDELDILASIVNFGALTGFIMLHVCVIVHFLIRRRSGRWILHGAGPLIGIVSVLTVLSGMSELAVTLGLSWIAGGLVYGLVLKVRRKSAPLPISSTGCG